MANNSPYAFYEKANKTRIKLLLLIDNEIHFQRKQGKNIKLANEYLFHIDYKERFNHKEFENCYFSFTPNPKTIILNEQIIIIEKQQQLTKFSRDDSASTNDTIVQKGTLKKNYTLKNNKEILSENKNKKTYKRKKNIYYLKQLCNKFKKMRKARKDLLSYKASLDNLQKKMKYGENNDIINRKSVNKKYINNVLRMNIRDRARTCKKADSSIKRDYTNKGIVRIKATLSLVKDVVPRKKKVVCFKDIKFN